MGEEGEEEFCTCVSFVVVGLVFVLSGFTNIKGSVKLMKMDDDDDDDDVILHIFAFLFFSRFCCN